MSRENPSLQHGAALLFAALATEGVCGPGTLTVAWDGADAALGLAITGLGGTCILVFADAHKAKAAARLGATDFTVDSLSEALRILKNEVRQQRPVSVGLVADAATVAREMLERGAQPEVVAAGAELPWTQFVERGAQVLDEVLRHGAVRVVESYTLRRDVAETGRVRRERDAVLLAEEGDRLDAIARRWLVLAPRLFSHDRVRWYWVANAGSPPSGETRKTRVLDEEDGV